MKFKPVIIGIAGTKHSGKDTIASIISYIMNIGIAKATYYNWYLKQDIYKNNCIIHFADKLKDYCSEIFNIDRKYFDNTYFKDENYWSITLQKFISNIDYIESDNYKEITIDDLKNHNYNLIETRKYINTTFGKTTVISLRTIMQYIGTEIFRNLINKDIWIDLCIKEAKDIAFSGYCIIPDVRFENEKEAIKNSGYKNLVIKVERNTQLKDNHESEIIDFNCDITINNNSTLQNLFYKVVSLLNTFINENN